MSDKYKFEENLKDDMPLPEAFDSIQVLNMAYAGLVRVAEKRDPGFAKDLLSTLDKLYEQNDGLKGQLAVAQIARLVKHVTSDSK